MRILYVEDSPADADLAQRELARADPASTLEIAPTLADARRRLAGPPACDLVLLDLRLPDGNGMDLLRDVRHQGLAVAVVILTSAGDEELAVAALKAGADDYVAKREGYVARLPALLEGALARFRAESARRAGTLRVLYAERHLPDVELTRRHLEKHAAHIRLEVVDNAEAVLRRLRRGAAGEASACDVLLLDYRLPGETALDVLKVVRQELSLDLAVVLVTGQGDEDVAAQALRLGATDYLVKSPNYLYALPAALESAHGRVLLGREQAALRDSRARLLGVIESAMDAIVSADQDERVVLFNRAAETLFGWRREDAMGQHLSRFIPERLRAGHRRPAAEGSRPGLTARTMAHKGSCGLRRDGVEFPIEASLSECRVAGGELYTLIVRDITERRQAEEERRALDAQLRQSQKMEAIGRLAGGVAHDFNNMLNVMLGHAELALRKLRPADPVGRNLEAIRDATQRSADLTRRLLAFSRQQPSAPQVIDLNARLAGMEGLLQRIIGEDVALAFVLSAAAWPVSLDPSQVDQIVANLAVNSRDAMPEGGKLVVETANVTLDEAYCRHRSALRPGDYVMLAVSDTGCGMDEATRERAFEPFFTTKPEGMGTGLGLPIVYGIVKQNEGAAEIYSEVGHGTTVKVYLPRGHGDEKVKAAAAPPAAAPVRGRETVLLVEDQDQVRALTRTLLEELGYTVVEAAGPGQALAACEKQAGDIALLVTDVVMPTMNGVELADRVRAVRPGIRTLFTSGYTPEAIARRRALEPGVHFLEKPFTMDALSRKLREALARE